MMKNQDNQYYKLDKDADIKYDPPGADITIEPTTTYKVNPNVKIRKEYFGAAIRVGYSEYFITEEILQLYYLLKELLLQRMALLVLYLRLQKAKKDIIYVAMVCGLI
jgi:hypothetical protein